MVLVTIRRDCSSNGPLAGGLLSNRLPAGCLPRMRLCSLGLGLPCTCREHGSKREVCVACQLKCSWLRLYRLPEAQLRSRRTRAPGDQGELGVVVCQLQAPAHPYKSCLLPLQWLPGMALPLLAWQCMHGCTSSTLVSHPHQFSPCCMTASPIPP